MADKQEITARVALNTIGSMLMVYAKKSEPVPVDKVKEMLSLIQLTTSGKSDLPSTIRELAGALRKMAGRQQS